MIPRRAGLLAAIFLLAMALYARTLAPDVYVADFAEFQYLPAQLGLAHPNGFPLYMLLGWAWSHIPLGALAWRMNLLSALGGALAAMLTAGFVGRITQRSAPMLLAAGLTALMPTFWSYSLVAERYTINLALTVSLIWAAWEAARSGRRALAYVSAALFGLGLTIHPTNAVFGPFWLGYLAWRLPAARRSIRFWIGLLFAAGAPMLLYLYVPWRWGALSAWPMAPTGAHSEAALRGLAHVWYQPGLQWDLIRDYITLNTTAANLVRDSLAAALHRVSDLGLVWRTDAPWWLLALAGVGLIRLWGRERALASVLAGFAATLTLVVAYIQQGKNDAYLLPATWIAALLASLALDLALAGSAALARRHPRAGGLARGALCLGTVALLSALAWTRYPMLDKSRASDTGRWWRATLAHPIEPDASLLAHWSDLTPMWYLQHAEGIRPELLGSFPPDAEMVIDPWLATGRPLYLAGPLHGWTPDLPERYTLVPWGNLIRVLPHGEQPSCPPLAQRLDTPAAWPLEITGWELEAELTGAAGEALRFCWQARTALPRATLLAVTLQPASGGPALRLNEPLVVGWHPADTLPAGSEGLAVLPLRLPHGAPAGRYTVTLMPYHLPSDSQIEAWAGVEAAILGEVAIAPTAGFKRSALADAIAPLIAPTTNSLALRAWRLSDAPVRPGDPIELALWWEVRNAGAAPPAATISLRGWDGEPTTITQALLPPGSAEAWAPGAVLQSVHVIPAPRGRGDRAYLMAVRVTEGPEWLAPLPIGVVRVVDRPHITTLPEGIQPIEADFGDFARLAGYSPLAAPKAGEDLTLTLIWQPTAETELSYSVFVHLTDAGGRLVAQHDSRPAQGSLPTDIWVRNEFISDPHTLPLPADLPGGVYALQVGLYLPDSWARAPVTSALPHADNALRLTTITITR